MAVVCAKCGAPLAEGVQFCAACGAAVSAAPLSGSGFTPVNIPSAIPAAGSGSAASSGGRIRADAGLYASEYRSVAGWDAAERRLCAGRGLSRAARCADAKQRRRQRGQDHPHRSGHCCRHRNSGRGRVLDSWFGASRIRSTPMPGTAIFRLARREEHSAEEAREPSRPRNWVRTSIPAPRPRRAACAWPSDGLHRFRQLYHFGLERPGAELLQRQVWKRCFGLRWRRQRDDLGKEGRSRDGDGDDFESRIRE